MTIQELREKLEASRAKMEETKPIIRGSRTGPAGFQQIEWLIDALEAQEARIAELEQKLAGKP